MPFAPGPSATSLLAAIRRRRGWYWRAAPMLVALAAVVSAWPLRASVAWSAVAVLVTATAASVLFLIVVPGVLFMRERRANRTVVWYLTRVSTPIDRLLDRGDTGEAETLLASFSMPGAWGVFQRERLRARLGVAPAATDVGQAIIAALGPEDRLAAARALAVDRAASLQAAGDDWFGEVSRGDIAAGPDVFLVWPRWRWRSIGIAALALAAAIAAMNWTPTPRQGADGLTWFVAEPAGASGTFRRDDWAQGPRVAAILSSALERGTIVATRPYEPVSAWYGDQLRPIFQWAPLAAQGRVPGIVPGQEVSEVLVPFGAFERGGPPVVWLEVGQGSSATMLEVQVDRQAMRSALDLFYPGGP